MQISRRGFLLSGAAALAASAAAPGRLLAEVEKQTPALPDLSSWPAIRAQFSVTPQYLHFSSFFIASHPRPVRDAIEGFRRAIDANPLHVVEHGMFTTPKENLQHRVCAAMAPYLGAKPDEIALTPNTTTGLALVYHGLPLRAGDEVLTTAHDHFSHHESIRLATARAGAKHRRIALFENSAVPTVSGIVSRIRDAIRPATRVVGITWVHSSTGVRLPVRAIADAIAVVNRGRGTADRVLLVVDGVHGLGAVDETVADLGADFFSAGTHKWMWAPRGTGILWARPENWARLQPVIPSFSDFPAYEAWMNGSAPPATTASAVAPGGFLAYEHQWAMGAAFRMHEKIGRARVAGRIRELNDQLKAGLAKMRGVRLHTPLEAGLSAGITCFEVDGTKPEDIVRRLGEKRILASTSPYKVTFARLAPSLLNDPQQVEVALREVRAIALNP